MAASFLIATLAFCCIGLPAAFSVDVFGGRNRGFLKGLGLTENGVNTVQVLQDASAMSGHRDSESSDLSSALLFHREYAAEPVGKPKYLKSFSWKNCGDPSKESFVLTSLSLTPDPIKIPGNITVSFHAQFKSTVDKPLKMDLKFEKKVFGIWIEIPCVDNIGSCTYDDICEKLEPQSCPKQFVEQGVPCKCPFKLGMYTLKDATFALKTTRAVPSGEYRLTANLSSTQGDVGCYEIAAELA